MNSNSLRPILHSPTYLYSIFYDPDMTLTLTLTPSVLSHSGGTCWMLSLDSYGPSRLVREERGRSGAGSLIISV